MNTSMELIDRIKNIYTSVDSEEQKILLQILNELAEYGYSETYQNIWLSDYKEIPVDKETFLTSTEYLGASNNNGKSIYPIWMDTMKELEDTGNQYYEIVFTGATRTGKTSTAVSDAAYQLYRIMCLRNPQEYFSLKAVTSISIFFFNITQTLAKGVAFKEFNNTLKTSKWFMSHGKMSKSESNPTYIPEGDLIEVTYGSEASHALGKATYCCIGSTEVLTESGYEKIETLLGDILHIGQYTPNGNLIFVDAHAILTKYVQDTIQIELEDGTIFEGTSDHKVLLIDGTYKELQHLEISDELQTLNCKIYRSEVNGVKAIKPIHYDNPIPVYDIVNAEPYHNFIVHGNTQDVVMHNCVIFDECNFAAAGIQDVEKSKKRMKEKYDTLVARVTGTFVKNGEVFGKLYVISSKKSDSDFMEEYISKQRNAGNKHMYVFDKPQWEVWPKSKYSSDKKFHIAIGGKSLKSYVIPDDHDDEESLNAIREQGYEIISVPEDNKTRFLSDFDVALRDIAGIAVQGSMSFISQETLDRCIGNRKNPFPSDILSIGTKDSLTIQEFFDISKLDPSLKSKDWFIHLDLSLNDDKSGIGCCCITGRKDVLQDDNSMLSLPFISHVFSIDIESPKGDKIPYAKITDFICWLRKSGFHIELITRDQYQSEYMSQLLEAQGFNTGKISLDRTPEGYKVLRSVLLEERIDMLHIELLERELTRLKRDSYSGKVDHEVGQSKDMSDGFAGSVWSAVKYGGTVKLDRKKITNVISSVNNTHNTRSGRSSGNMFTRVIR